MIIGLIGKKGSGKSWAANYLLNTYGFPVYSFAEPIKDMIQTLYKYSETYSLIEPEKETFFNEAGITFRKLYQTLGTEWGRKTVNEDLWVNLMRTRIAGLKHLVIDDVRFLNEIKFVCELGGTIIKIVGRDDPTNDQHTSENDAVDFDFVHTITNDYNSTIFCRKIDKVFQTILLEQQTKELL